MGPLLQEAIESNYNYFVALRDNGLDMSGADQKGGSQRLTQGNFKGAWGGGGGGGGLDPLHPPPPPGSAPGCHLTATSVDHTSHTHF